MILWLIVAFAVGLVVGAGVCFILMAQMLPRWP